MVRGEVRVKDYFVPFVVGLVICGMVFLALDYSVMKLMGLTLIYHP